MVPTASLPLCAADVKVTVGSGSLSRIVAVADVFDALTSQRPYRNPASPEEAFAFLEDGVGKHYDGEVVAAFKRFFFRVPEVDQVTVVRKHLARLIAVLLAVFLEKPDAFFGQRVCEPLPLVLGEQGKCLRPYIVRVHGGILHPARCADMCSYIFHGL